MASQVLVVTTNPARLATVMRVLRGAGYAVSGAQTFAEAKQQLEEQAPEVIVTEARLGAFNGLHLAVLGRARHAGVKALVVSTESEQWVELEARRLNVEWLAQPTTTDGWVELIAATLAGKRAAS